MEQLNRVELVGYVGSVRITPVSCINSARFTVATNLMYRNKASETIVETTWFNVQAWEAEKTPFKGLEKGAKVHVVGRLRNVKYIDAEGQERTSFEIIASSIEILDPETILHSEH